MNGYIKAYRQGFDHDFFERSPVSEWEAWMRLIARAAWKDTRHRVGSKMHAVKRGSFFCTLRDLQAEFMWGSPNRVERFLRRLEKENMVRITRGTGKTQITVCNYEKYQGSRNSDGTATEQPAEHARNTKEEDKKTIPVGTTDVAGILFTSGVSLLTASGKSEGQARSIIGKWRKSHTDGSIIDAIGRAQREGAVDPVPFIVGCLQPKRPTHKPGDGPEWWYS